MLEPTNTQYEDALKEFLRYVQEDAPYTPEGLVFLDIWGSNRHSANVAFLALWVSDRLRSVVLRDMTVNSRTLQN